MDAGMAALPPPARPRTNLEGSRSTRELQQMWRDSQALSANAHFHPINAPSQGRKERSMSWTSDLSANELGALLPPAALSSRRFTSSVSFFTMRFVEAL